MYRGDGRGHIVADRRQRHPPVPLGELPRRCRRLEQGRQGRRADARRRPRAACTWCTGTGRGTFGAARLLSKGWAGYTCIAPVGDLTGDGRADVVGLKNHSVYVGQGVHGGGLGAPARLTTLTSQWDALVGGGRDLNGDGVGDVVVRSRTTGQPEDPDRASRAARSVRRSVPSPVWWTLRAPRGQMGGSAAPDVVGTRASGTQLVVVLSNGLTNVGKSTATNLRVPGATQVLNVGDWNRDGKSDVVTRETPATP